MGIPFAVTELVEGMPITYFAATKSLSINDRLFLFIDVCRAVDDAHRAQIVHGSLQPRNILVTKKREVKLQGFAFSELIGPHEDDSKGSATILAAVYKAPELFSGSCTAIASDVYALGILLEELVALMHRHHPARNRPFGEVEDFYAARLVGGVNDQIATSFGDDLNHVILKATALLPEERYQSAGSVADEVERFLSRKHARDGDQSKLNSARLFFRQNWGVVLIITFYFGAMIATLTAILYYLI
jgi:serine/threonine-protein kinase